MGEGGKDSREKVEEKIVDLAENSFDVIAEQPEVPHVSKDVVEPAVEEHRGEGGKDAACDGNKTEGEDKELKVLQGENESQDINYDQCDRDCRERDSRVDIF